MKTLSDLKRECQNYTWEQYYNSWYGGYLKPDNKFYGLQRKIEKKQTNAIKFEGGSWLEFPKSGQLEITDKIMNGGQEKPKPHSEFIVTIKGIDDKDCTLYYHLRKI